MKNGQDFDLSDMTLLEMPSKQVSQCYATVNERGEFFLSPKLLGQLSEKSPTLELEIRKNDTYRLLSFALSDTPNFQFPKSGRMKHKALMEQLKNRGYGLPARYLVQWEDELGIWLGRLQEIAPSPKLNGAKRKRDIAD